MRRLLAAAALSATIVGVTAGPAFASSEWAPSSGQWIRAAESGQSLCGAALATDSSGTPEADAFTTRENNETCTGSLTGSQGIAAHAVLQQSYAFVWIDCGDDVDSKLGNTAIAATFNDSCSETGDHWWRSVTTHGGLINLNTYTTNHWPLVTNAILW